MVKSSWKTALLLFILSAALLSSFFRFRLLAEDASGDDLFRFVWDDDLRGYYIVSDKVFSLKVYVLSLPDVGNYRVSNHSDVVEGVKQAVEIRPNSGQVKELIIPLYGADLVMKLNVNTSCVIIEDWNAYKTLVESGNNTIIVNTHDEYLPIPEDYTKEGWTDKIADFMLNRWGTWVHAGGYPFYRLWHQNGTEEEWGENGFQRLMSHIGNGNVTCHPPPDWHSDNATLSLWVAQSMGIIWFWKYTQHETGYLADFDYADLGYPINYKDFEQQHISGIYSCRQYEPGAIIRYSQNRSAFNFGIYIHMGTCKFYDGGGNEEPSDFVLGFISTAAAIYEEFSDAVCKLYGRMGNSATEVIQKAEKEGRTVG